MSNENNNENNYSSNGGNSSDRNSSKIYFSKRKGCPLCSSAAPVIDYKNPDLLSKFISEGGRMLPSRITNICAKQQRQLSQAIKNSRIIALLPFVFHSK